MPNPQWVISKYARPEDEAEKFEVDEEYGNCYQCIDHSAPNHRTLVSKSEYLPTTPPERWEEVPIETVLSLRHDDRDLVSLVRVELWCAKNERFVIQDGKLVLQRRII